MSEDVVANLRAQLEAGDAPIDPDWVEMLCDRVDQALIFHIAQSMRISLTPGNPASDWLDCCSECSIQAYQVVPYPCDTRKALTGTYLEQT
jgi:hypothetical protein